MKREQGLSEVIGFLMIVSLLAILFSMYLLYVVPLQGRDAEIAHMDIIKDQFLGIKTDIDSLILNNNEYIELERSIPLGTSTGSGSGSLSIVPMNSFTGSEGSLQIYNQGYGIMTIEMNGSFQPSPIPLPNAVTSDSASVGTSTITLNYNPENFILNYTTSSLPPTPSTGVIIQSFSSKCGNWVAFLNTSPNYVVSAKDIINTSDPGNHPSYPFITYDLSISVMKNNRYTFQNLTIYKNIQINTLYPIDLYDPTYGLVDCLDRYIPINVSYSTYTPYLANIYIPNQNSNITPVWSSNLNTPTTEISRLSYTSNNNYYINQNIEYEGGAIFLNQNSGSSVLVRPPLSISSSNDYINVDLYNIIFKNSETVGGSLEVPVYSSLSDLSSINSSKGYPLCVTPPNAQYINLTYKGSDYQKWYEAFSQCAVNAINNKFVDSSLINVNKSIINATNGIANISITTDITNPKLFVNVTNAYLYMAFQSKSI